MDSLLLEVQACDFDGAVESSSEFTALQEALGDVAKFNSHITDYNNPHQVNGNQIRTGVIRGEAENGPYFDLNANSGEGEMAATKLIHAGASEAVAQILENSDDSVMSFSSSDPHSVISLQLTKNYKDQFEHAMRGEFVTSGDTNIRANAAKKQPNGI